jgi:hypothetical protein
MLVVEEEGTLGLLHRPAALVVVGLVKRLVLPLPELQIWEVEAVALVLQVVLLLEQLAAPVS